jgi:hypothetical protein
MKLRGNDFYKGFALRSSEVTIFIKGSPYEAPR